MRKNTPLFIAILIVCAVGGFLLLKTFFQTTDPQQARKRAQLTPPPTQPLAKTSTQNDSSNMKTLTFPSFRLTLKVPANLKQHKEIDPQTEDSEIGSNFVALYAPDAMFDEKHVQTAGAKLSVKITDTKQTFTDEKDIIPAIHIKEATEDTTVIPEKNAVLTNKTLKVYSFPTDKTASTSAWAYNAEALLKNGGNMLSVTLYCVDYSHETDSTPCQQLLKTILPTIQH